MKVFSRKSGDRILISKRDLEIRILGIDDQRVTLGILGSAGGVENDSEKNLAEHQGAGSVAENRVDPAVSRARGKAPHQIRNRINSVALALHALRNQVAEQSPIDPELLDHAIAELKSLDLDEIESNDLS